MAHDVFISYSTDDANEANAIVNALESNGARCWIAGRDIQPGEIWAQAIMTAISGSRIAVVVFSASANSSKDVLNEVDAAIRKGLIVIPFRIEKVAPDGAMEYHLRTRHWLDAMTPDLESGIKRLVGDVKAILSGEPRPAEPLVASRHERKTSSASESSDSKTTIRIPKLTVFLARFWGRHRKRILAAGGVALAVLIGWLALHRSTVSGVKFAVPLAGRGSFPIVERKMRFFEGGFRQTDVSQRSFAVKFPTAATRYINVELSLDHDRAERPVPLPISCTFYKPDGGVYAIATQNLRIEADRQNSTYVVGWGANVPGTWPPAKYRTDCRYGDKLIGRDRFEITGDASLTIGPPDIQSLGAHVVGMKFFESGAGALPPETQRIFAERFDAGAARHINTEILTNHPATGRVVDLPVSCTYTKPDGSVLYVTQNTFNVPANYENTSFATGTGWEDAGHWLPGLYRVSCTGEGKTIGQGSFEVVGR
jgi:hypothetical protein